MAHFGWIENKAARLDEYEAKDNEYKERNEKRAADTAATLRAINEMDLSADLVRNLANLVDAFYWSADVRAAYFDHVEEQRDRFSKKKTRSSRKS